MGRILAVWVWLSLALAVPVTFRYTLPSGLEVRSVSLRGSFNSWGETPMQKEDGSWAVTVDLDPGEHQYKFFINGQWPRDMCNDPTFGTPMVDPKAAGCVDDGFGGQNAVIVVQAPVAPTPPAGPVALDFTQDPLDPSLSPMPTASFPCASGRGRGRWRPPGWRCRERDSPCTCS